MCDALRFATDAEREAVRARVRGRAATLEAVWGQAVGWEAAAGALQAGFAQALNLTLAAGALSEFEQNEAEQLTREKYAADNWNARA